MSDHKKDDHSKNKSDKSMPMSDKSKDHSDVKPKDAAKNKKS